MTIDIGAHGLGGGILRVGVWVIVLARVCGLCLTAPALAIKELDWRFRLGLTAALGAVLIPVIEPTITPPTSWPSAVLAIALEVLTGGILGWSAAMVVAGARQGGELVAAQAGLSTATLFDPETGEEHTPLGQLYGWIALAAFLALDGPLALVRALVESYQAFPSGRLFITPVTGELACRAVSRAVGFAVRVAAPPALALVGASTVLALLNRAATSLPFVALTPPIRITLGIVVVVVSLATLAATISVAWESVTV